MAAAAAATPDAEYFDESLLTFGLDNFETLRGASVLVAGVRGLGLEVAVNLARVGVGRLCLWDPSPISPTDLTAAFLYKPTDVGANRAAVCAQRLSEHCGDALGVDIEVYDSPICGHDDYLLQFSAVVMTGELNLAERVRISAICRGSEPPIKIVVAESRGLAGYVFGDVGDAHRVEVPDISEPAIAFVTAITAAHPPALTIEYRHDSAKFGDGDLVVVTRARGMTEINNMAPARVRVSGRGNVIELVDVDASAFGAYLAGGVVTSVKEAFTVAMQPIGIASLDAALVTEGFFSIGTTVPVGCLHACFQALDEFQTVHDGEMPALGSQRDENDFEELLANIPMLPVYDEAATMPAWLPRLFARHAVVEVAPVAITVAAAAAQEVVKGLTGWTRPLNQFVFFDFFDCLEDPAATAAMPPEAPMWDRVNVRQTAELIVFGSETVRALGDLRVTLAGAGAAGCALGKTMALMGVAAGKGVLTVCDTAVVSRAGLAANPLLAQDAEGELAATALGAALQEIDTAVSVTTLLVIAGSSNDEAIACFDETFWQRQDLIVGAGGVSEWARLDSKSVRHRLPLLVGGARDATSSTTVAVPDVTESYSNQAGADDWGYVGFDHKASGGFHTVFKDCVGFAVGKADDIFDRASVEAQRWVADGREAFDPNPGATLSVMEGVADLCAFAELEPDLAACVTWARDRFDDLFDRGIRDLLDHFPVDLINEETGELFWRGNKHPPHPTPFDADDDMHVRFVVAAASLRARQVGLPFDGDDFDDQAKVLIASVETEVEEGGGGGVTADYDAALEALLENTPRPDAHFERLPDRKHPETADRHATARYLAFLVTTSSLRARCFDIQPESPYLVKRWAGRLKPSLVTITASLACGAAEIYKLAQGRTESAAYRNTTYAAAIPMVARDAPQQVVVRQGVADTGEIYYPPEGHTVWTRLEIAGSPATTLAEITAWFAARGLTVEMMASGVSLLYASFMPRHADRLGRPLVDIVREVTARRRGDNAMDDAPLSVVRLEVACVDGSGADVAVPPVHVDVRELGG